MTQKRTRKPAGKVSRKSSIGSRYTEIVRQNWRFVCDTARWRGVAERHREDIAIEVFLRFQKHTGTITSPRAIRAWLRTATIYVAHEHFDEPSATREQLTTAEAIKLSGQAASAEDGIIRRQQIQLLINHIDTLEPGRRAVFRAYSLEEIPMAEVAKRLGIPTPTAYNRLRLARRDLRAALRREQMIEDRKLGKRRLLMLPLLILLSPEGLRRLLARLRALLRALRTRR